MRNYSFYCADATLNLMRYIMQQVANLLLHRSLHTIAEKAQYYSRLDVV